MGSIIKKKIKNSIYYYYVESKRVDGKPRYVNQKYLGTAEALLAKVLSAEAPLQSKVLYSQVKDFGDVALLFDIAKRLGLVKMIDQVVPKRKQGASIGTYLLTAAINRAAAPTSKNQLSDWYASTCLPMLMGITPNTFSPQNFWNNTRITNAELDEIEEIVLKKIVIDYQLDTSHIIYDATNFFTYIDTMQECESAKRGHSKEKRNDLRIVGLSLMVTADCNIPLLHETYPGNRADSTEFNRMMEQLKRRYERITNCKSDVTVVFDRGNNSAGNIEFLEAGDLPLHYIGGLRKNQVWELFEYPQEVYTPLAEKSLEGQTAYRTKRNVYNRDCTVLIVHNPRLEEGQLQGIKINIEKTTVKLLAVQQKLMRWATGETQKGRKPTAENVTGSVEKILKVEYMKEVFDYKIIEKDEKLYLTFAASEAALEEIRKRELGKTALFTDRHDFTNEEIVNAYRSAWHVEAAFKQLKNTDHLTVRPIFHWTDEKIRVHIFTCVLAYRLSCLLIKELDMQGIHTNINEMLNEMSKIKSVDTFFTPIEKPEKVHSFTKGKELAQKIEALYRLKENYS